MFTGKRKQSVSAVRKFHLQVVSLRMLFIFVVVVVVVVTVEKPFSSP